MTRLGPVGGVIGAGMISHDYLTRLARHTDVEVVAIGDWNIEGACTQAASYIVPTSGDVASVLANDDVSSSDGPTRARCRSRRRPRRWSDHRDGRAQPIGEIVNNRR
jgi:hypothetical protein